MTCALKTNGICVGSCMFFTVSTSAGSLMVLVKAAGPHRAARAAERLPEPWGSKLQKIGRVYTL